MKPIRYILASYFQQGYSQVMMLVMSLVILLIGILHMVYSNRGVDDVFQIILFLPAIMIAATVSIYLKDIAASDAAALIPGFRRKQLQAAGIVLGPFVFLPVLVLAVKGLPVLSILAMILISMSAMLILGDNNPGFGPMLLILLPLWLVYELLGFEPRADYIPTFSQLTGFGSNNLFALFTIVLSLALAAYFSLRFFRGELKLDTATELSSSGKFTALYDRLDIFSAGLVYRKIGKLLAGLKIRRPNLYNLICLYQYALFNPRSSLMLDISNFSWPLFILVYFYLVVHWNFFDTVLNFVPVMIAIYHVTAIAITTEFLQHRDRISSLWLQSPLSSRRGVTSTILLAYLAMCGRQYLKISLMLLLLPLFIPNLFHPGYLAVMAVGVLPYIFLVAFSLRMSDEVTSATCSGWSLLNILFVIPAFIINSGICHELKNITGYLMIFLMLTMASLVYLWFASRSWSETEMNFIGPEVTL